MKRILAVIGAVLICLVIIGVVYFSQNYTFTEGYVVNKSENSLLILPGDSPEDAIETFEKNNRSVGLGLQNLNPEKIENIQMGAKIKAYHSRMINASSPSFLEPLYFYRIEK